MLRLSHPRTQTAFLLALLLLVILLSIRMAYRVADDRSAFRRWQPQLLQLQHGRDISAEHNFPNPPIMAVLLEPLAHLPPIVGALTWFYLKALLAALSVYWVLRTVDSGGQPFPAWAWMLVVLAGLKPILDDLAHGNVNLFLLFLVIAALTAYRCQHDVTAGVVLALAIACKLTPALFLPYFVWKRSWRVLAGSVVGLALFLWPGIVPGLRLGMVENHRQLVSWYDGMVHPYLIEGKITTEHVNQSLPALFARLMTHSPSFIGWEGHYPVALRYDNFVSLSLPRVKLLVQLAMLGFVLIVITFCRTPTQPRTGWRLPAEFALITLGMLLFSERTWKHHAVTLVLPFAVLIYALARGHLSRRWNLTLVAVFVVSQLLLLLPGLGTSKDRFATGHAPDFAKLMQVYGAYTWTFLLLAGTLVALLRNDREAAR